VKIDALFKQIQIWHGSQPWGDVLDAGTGEHSLRWLAGLPTDSLTAITASSQRSEQLDEQFKNILREQDCILNGNWLNQLFLQKKTYDTVVADYLLGAVEGFSPYFQEDLFRRLRRHCRTRLYIVGQEPFPQKPQSKGGALVMKISRLRDACILLAGHNCYREYPKSWALQNLQRNGYRIEHSQSKSIVIGKEYMLRQLNVCQNKLSFFSDRIVAREMLRHITNTKEEVSEFIEKKGIFSFGSDYVICAEPQERLP
jgi:hypothetical protein